MKASEALIEKLKEFEGLRLVAYKPRGEKDTGGRLTIGYGHLGAAPNQRITKEQAEALLRRDVEHIERNVGKLGLPPLTQGQFDAIVDFCFNLGLYAFSTSTLCRYIRAGANTETIQAEFRRWVYSGKKKLPGLVRRREWEAKMWERG